MSPWWSRRTNFKGTLEIFEVIKFVSYNITARKKDETNNYTRFYNSIWWRRIVGWHNLQMEEDDHKRSYIATSTTNYSFHQKTPTTPWEQGKIDCYHHHNKHMWHKGYKYRPNVNILVLQFIKSSCNPLNDMFRWILNLQQHLYQRID